MYNFYPGPSCIYPSVKGFAEEAFLSGILERNHRSEDFMLLLEECMRLLKEHLNVPPDYKIFFTSSATECWEICAQSFMKGGRFYYNGAFGEKWKVYSERIAANVDECVFGVEEELPLVPGGDVFMVANETSNGTSVHPQLIRRAGSGDGLLVIDAVSSMGGVNHAISAADIWITSSQKCFGLPSGMGIMILSPRALSRAREVGDRRYYNSALFMESNFSRFQTPYTPNILAIYLLKRLLEALENVNVIAERVSRRAGQIYGFLDQLGRSRPLISNALVRSDTVIAVSCVDVTQLTEFLSRNGVIVGKGYGEWAGSTYRIANFPAISDKDFEVLFHLLRNFENQ